MDGNRYATDVLVGNWYEERVSINMDHHAIAPGVYGISGCIKDETIYKKDFKEPVPESNIMQGAERFFEIRMESFRNRHASKEPNLCLYNDNAFLNNFTTLTDLQFRILPKRAIDNPTVLALSRKEDFLRSIGNQTETGLLRMRRCESERERRRYNMQTEYKELFVPKKMPRELPLRKKDSL